MEQNYYHFSEVTIPIGETIRGSICKNEIYINQVAPAYSKAAKNANKFFPVNHGYAYDKPILYIMGISKNSKDLAKLVAERKATRICHVLEAKSEVSMGPADYSPQIATYKLLGYWRDSRDLEAMSRGYFMTGYSIEATEFLCENFVVKSILKNWTVEDMTTISGTLRETNGFWYT